MNNKVIKYVKDNGDVLSVKIKEKNRSVQVHKRRDGYVVQFKRLRDNAEKPACIYRNPKPKLAISEIGISEEGFELMIVAYLQLLEKTSFTIQYE